jgi:hypothetical protein
MTAGWGPIVQNAYLVENIEQAAAAWSRQLGIGPFLHLPVVECSDVSWRGEPVEFPLATAVGYSGNLQIELLLMQPEQMRRFPELFRTGANKLHHYQVRTDDLDELIAARGLTDKVLLKGHAVAGMKFCFVDLDLPDGSLLEITEPTAEMLGFMNAFQQVAAGWPTDDALITAEALMAELGKSTT